MILSGIKTQSAIQCTVYLITHQVDLPAHVPILEDIYLLLRICMVTSHISGHAHSWHHLTFDTTRNVLAEIIFFSIVSRNSSALCSADIPIWATLQEI